MVIRRKPITDQQVRIYRSDLQNHSQRTAAARARLADNPHDIAEVEVNVGLERAKGGISA